MQVFWGPNCTFIIYLSLAKGYFVHICQMLGLERQPQCAKYLDSLFLVQY